MISKTELEIMKDWKGDLHQPIVSICSITYNHEKFIEEALDSFLMQETNLPFEIIIDDDFSKDETASIIRKYERNFPRIVKARLRTNNIGMINNYTKNVARAKGKYIALCEGDDYWTDAKKIQRQVDFLDKNTTFVFCFHDYDTWNEEEKTYIKNVSAHHSNFPINSEYSATKILLGPFVTATLTLMYRNILDRPLCLNTLPFGDKSFEKLLAFYGKGYFLNDSMACYRNHAKGISKDLLWQERMSNQEMINIDLYECLKKSFFPKYIEVLNCRINYHKMLLENGKNIQVINKYIKLSRSGFFDKSLLRMRLVSRLYFPMSMANAFEKLYYQIYKLFLTPNIKEK
ncbi:MAG: glycosyltransferase [Sulfurovum sp.]|nr:glycosyltransferase [Sulfurovum sp.]